MVELVMGVQIAKHASALDPLSGRSMHGPMQVFVQAVIGSEGCHAAPKEREPADNLRPPHEGHVDRQEQRALPPLEENRVPIFLLSDLVGRISPKDPMMEERVYLTGMRDEPPPMMQDPPMKGVLEQTRVEEEEDETCTGAESCDQS
jgi:hypothetical protein